VSRGKRTLGALAVAVVLAGGWLVAARAGGPANDLDWVAVERADLVLGVDVEGEIEAIDEIFLSPPSIPGQHQFRISFLAPEGSRVAAGQPVLGFDTTELETQLQERIADRDSAQAEMEKRRTDLGKKQAEVELQLSEARAKLRKTELQLEVPEDLVAAKELAAQEIDRRLAEREIAYLEERAGLFQHQGEIELGSLAQKHGRAAARVEEIREQLGRMQVAAPRAGVVIYAANWQDEKPKVGDTTWRGNPVLQVPDLDRLQAAGLIDEADVGTVATGQRVTLRLDAHPDRQIVGRVTEVARTVQRRSPREPEKVVRLAIALEDVEPELVRPGMRFRGQVETERREAVLTVPAGAVTPTPDGPVVYRRSAFGFERVRPELGSRNIEAVEVLSGLEAGDRVALGVPEGAPEAGP
jgi:HlyD family secretion protein